MIGIFTYLRSILCIPDTMATSYRSPHELTGVLLSLLGIPCILGIMTTSHWSPYKPDVPLSTKE